MAHSPALSADEKAEITRLYQEGHTTTYIANKVGRIWATVDKFRLASGIPAPPRGKHEKRDTQASPTDNRRQPPTMPPPAPEAGGPGLPNPVRCSYEPVHITASGTWLVINDLQMPFHDVRTVETAFKEARERNVAGILFNGDVLDCADLSDHCKTSDTPKIEEEIEGGEQLFAYTRSRFPKAELVWKAGNHEERLPRYLANNAPELMGIKALTLPNLLHLENYGVRFIGEGEVVYLGRLPVIHAHEFGPGAGGVNPARWLFLRTVGTAMCAHFHRTSEHHERGIDGRLHGVWSVGCACFLFPRWRRLNKWNHGYAFVSIASDGQHFEVTNRRLLPDGKVV